MMSRDQPFAYMDHEVGKPQGGHHRVYRIWSLRLQLEWFTATRYSNDNFVGLLRSLQKLDPHVSLNIENGVSVYFQNPSGLVGMSFALVKI